MKNKFKKGATDPLICHSGIFLKLKHVFACLLLLNFLPLFLFAANQMDLQDIKLTIRQNNVTISKVLDEIGQLTGYSILVRDNDINIREVVSIHEKDKSPEQILAVLFKGKEITYEITDNTISIFKPDIRYYPATRQERVITGCVRDIAGDPLIGVTVMVKGDILNGTITDMDGRYSLSNVPRNAILEFSFVGMHKKEVRTDDKTVIDVILEEDVVGLEEVIVVGYTQQKKGLLTGSIVSMNVSEELETLPATAAGTILAGKLAGVDIGTSNGIPGSSPSLSIRTSSSWNAQNVLFVIDGIIRGEGDFNNLSPNEIENITVLKDAASAAIYGSRSAGGVVLITTKRGKPGKPVFKYSYSYGVDTRRGNVALTDAVQTGELYNRINPDSDPAGWAWSQEELDHYKTINNGWGYDQLDAVWRNPSRQAHNLNVNGGSEKVRYFGGVSYIRQEGFLEPQKYDKFNFRLNATVDVTDRLQFFAGMALSNNDRSEITWEGAESLYGKLLRWQPDQPVYTDSGQLVDYGWIANVGGETKGDGGYNRTNFLKPQLVFNLNYKVPYLEGLTAKALFGTNWDYTRNSEFCKNYEMAVLRKDGLNHHIIHTDDASILEYRKSTHNAKDFLQKRTSWGYDYQLNLQLNYERVFNKVHTVQGALVFEKSEASGASVTGGRETFPVYLTDQFWAASGARADTWGDGGADWKNGRISYIGQFNYAYANKYLASFSFRQDGSMNFAKEERWGFFPAGSLGWVISEESFFNTHTIDFLKIRASLGLTGNDNVGGWQWQESYQSGASAYFGRNPEQNVGITYGGVVNPFLTWEKSLSYNIGTDVNLFGNLHASMDYWFIKTYDILGKRTNSLPSTFSLTMPDENYGQVNAQGIDFSVGYRNHFREFGYFANLTMSYGWNKVIIKDHAENARWIEIEQGHSRTYQKGYRFDRIIRTQEELDRFIKENPGYTIDGLSPALGMMVYKDLSGPDGVPDGIIDSWDEDILYNSNHPIVYGLNLGGTWKGFGLDMMFNGKLNYKKSFRNLSTDVEWNRMWIEWYDNSWTPDHPDAWLPKRVSANLTRTYNKDSDFWFRDASFLRLKYITLSYELPKKITNRFVDRIRFYFTGTDLLTWSHFKYYDPELGDGVSFPIMRSFNFGVDVTF